MIASGYNFGNIIYYFHNGKNHIVNTWTDVLLYVFNGVYQNQN